MNINERIKKLKNITLENNCTENEVKVAKEKLDNLNKDVTLVKTRLGSILESEFTHNDFNCVVLITPMGHRCGYVEIPKSHKFYDEYDYMENMMHLSVHGGITYSGKLFDDDRFFIGFDCAHCNDAPDINLMSKKYKRFGTPYIRSGIIRDLNYVTNELKELTDQLDVKKLTK